MTKAHHTQDQYSAPDEHDTSLEQMTSELSELAKAIKRENLVKEGRAVISALKNGKGHYTFQDTTHRITPEVTERLLINAKHFGIELHHFSENTPLHEVPADQREDAKKTISEMVENLLIGVNPKRDRFGELMKEQKSPEKQVSTDNSTHAKMDPTKQPEVGNTR